MKKLLFATAFCVLSSQVLAQEPRYSTWSDPNKPQTSQSLELEKMIKELQTLVGEAEHARAADPKFLQDLKDLAARYDGSFERLLFKDDFMDGNYTANPTWLVRNGKYWIEKGYGLRSVVEKSGSSTQSSQSQEQKLSKEELIIGVLGAVLGGKVQQQQPQQQKTAPSPVQAADISLAHPINNAFRFELDMSSWTANSEFHWGPYQGTNQKTGYRLVYRSAQTPALQLMRHYASSSAVVASYNSLNLEDQKNHKWIWKRDKNGQMTVSLDDKVLIQITDHSFRDDFTGLALSNKSGDFTVKSIAGFGH